jgi:hypothetical protein
LNAYKIICSQPFATKDFFKRKRAAATCFGDGHLHATELLRKKHLKQSAVQEINKENFLLAETKFR